MDKLQEAFDRIQLDFPEYEGVTIVGDFNINWNADSTISAQLCEITDSVGVQQIVEDVTRPSNDISATGSTIDLVFTNRPEKFDCVDSIANLVSSDHHFSISGIKSPPQPNNIRAYLQYKSADLKHMETLLHLAPWSAFLDDSNPEASWEGIPRKQSRRKKFPWITDELKQLIRRKHILFSKAKSSRSSEAWQEFKHVRNKVKNTSKSAYWKYVSKLLTTPDNKRSFRRFVWEQKKSQCPASFQKDQTFLHKPADIVSSVHGKLVWQHRMRNTLF